MASLVSIIMPCYNAEPHLAQSISSILAQSHQTWELIAIDDGSHDGTLRLLRSQTDPRIRVLSQQNQGVSAARNAGLAIATGDYVAFLDSDDTWAADFLAHMVLEMDTNPSVGLVYCGWQNLGVAGSRGGPFVPPEYEGSDKKAALLTSNRWPIHAALTRRNLVVATGGFDRQFVVGEDFLLWLEIACFNTIRLVPRVLAYYHHHEGPQASRNRARAALQLLEVQEAFLQRHPGLEKEIGKARVSNITLGTLLKRGYDAYWKRDLKTAQKIFRHSFLKGGWKWRDLKYLLLAMLPLSIYLAILATTEKNAPEELP